MAIYDRRLELEGRPVIYYYDTDVIIGMIMGFELDISDTNPRGTERERLVRSILACEYLGTINILLPHAAELHEFLRRQPPSDLRISEQAFRSRVRRFLEARGIEGTMSRLLDIAHRGKTENRAEAIEEFLDFLGLRAGATFSAIEQVSGHWTRRYRRFYESGLLSFDNLGPEIRTIFDEHGEVVHRINDILRSYVQDKRAPIRILRDAAALAVLHVKAKKRDEAQTEQTVRFYTETNYLRRALKDDGELRELLSYSRPSFSDLLPTEGRETVYRSDSSFVMRVRFEELLPREALTQGGDGSAETLSNLIEMSKQIESLLELQEEDIENAIGSMGWQGEESRGLQEVIRTFEDLTLMQSLWVKDLRPSIKDLERWTEVVSFAHGKDTRAQLIRNIDDIQDELEGKIEQIQRWTRDFEILFDGAMAAPARLRGKIRSPSRDLGLVRWGFDREQTDSSGIERILDELVFAGEHSMQVEASRLATRMELARHDVSQCTLMAAVLWALGKHTELVELVAQVAATDPRTSLALDLMSAAAKIRSGVIGDFAEKERFIEDNRKKLDAAQHTERLRHIVGVAYIMYHAWKQEMVGANLLDSDVEKVNRARIAPAEVAREWARISFLLGQEAVEKLQPQSLLWAFAVNHCCYVGLMTGAEPEIIDSYYLSLNSLRGSPSWNYRFDDTVGCYALSQARDQLSHLKKEKDRDWRRLKEFVEDKVSLAEDELRRAEAGSLGDIDIEEHMGTLNYYKSILQRLKEEMPTA